MVTERRLQQRSLGSKTSTFFSLPYYSLVVLRPSTHRFFAVERTLRYLFQKVPTLSSFHNHWKLQSIPCSFLSVLVDKKKFSEKIPRDRLVSFNFDGFTGIAVAGFHPRIEHFLVGTFMPMFHLSSCPAFFLTPVHLFTHLS